MAVYYIRAEGSSNVYALDNTTGLKRYVRSMGEVNAAKAYGDAVVVISAADMAKIGEA